MKIKFFAIFLIVYFVASIPLSFGAQQNLSEGISSFEKLPDTIVPGSLYEFELKFQITDSPYWLRGMSPVVDISPKTDANNVHISFEKMSSGFSTIYRVPVTLYVDKNVSSEKIFLNVSFVSENSSGDKLRSSWSESAVLNISQLPLSAELPSSQDYEFATVSGASCMYDSSVCFGMFSNKTVIPIQCDYSHNCGAIPSDHDGSFFPSPLKQFKSGTLADETECRETLVLIQKNNGLPACVTLKIFDKLIQRGWGHPIPYSKLVMVDAPLNTYLTDMPISFTVKDTGWGHPCNSMYFSITDLETNEPVWRVSEVRSCPPTLPDDFFTHVSYVPDSVASELFLEAGDYKLTITSRQETLEHFFSVNFGEKEDEN